MVRNSVAMVFAMAELNLLFTDSGLKMAATSSGLFIKK